MSYIRDYLTTVENTEPPLEYHVWCMLNTLSVFAGRRFWFNLGSMTFYTNLYVVLVGDPGMRKSSAMNRAKGIVRASEVCPVAASQITKEALLLKMSGTVEGKPKKPAFEGQRFFQHGDVSIEYNQYAIFATELTQFIGVNPLGFLEFLTAVWDEPVVEVETKNKGCDYVIGPYITLVACMTPDIVKGFLKMNVLSSGFARRTAFVFSHERKAVPIPNYTDEQKAAERRCVEFGKRLAQRSGEFTWTQGLQDFYSAWYIDNTNKLVDRKPQTRGWFESKAEMLFKIAMLIALADEGPLVLDIPHYKLAMVYCDMVEKNLERVFEGTGENPDAMVAAQVSHMLERSLTPMNEKTLLLMFGDRASSWRAMQDTLSHLVMVGKLQKVSVHGQDNQLMGTLVGTKEAFRNRSAAELVVLLQPRDVPPPETHTDSPQETRPTEWSDPGD